MTTFPHWGQSSQLQFTKPYYKNLNNTYVQPVLPETKIISLPIFSCTQATSLSSYHSHQETIQWVPGALYRPWRGGPIPVPSRNPHPGVERGLEKYSRVQSRHSDESSFTRRPLPQVVAEALVGDRREGQPLSAVVRVPRQGDAGTGRDRG